MVEKKKFSHGSGVEYKLTAEEIEALRALDEASLRVLPFLVFRPRRQDGSMTVDFTDSHLGRLHQKGFEEIIQEAELSLVDNIDG